METKRRSQPRASGADVTAAATPAPAESPAEAAAVAAAPETEPASSRQQAAMAAEPPEPAGPPTEVAGYEPAPETEPTPAPQNEGDVVPDEFVRFAHAGFAALAESRAALAHGLTAMSDAMAELTRSGLDIAAGAATDTLGVKTLSDAYRVNARFASRSFDSWLDGSAKLSRLGIKLADEASRPILRRLGQRWFEGVRFAG
jgi:hypothetical protein